MTMTSEYGTQQQRIVELSRYFHRKADQAGSSTERAQMIETADLLDFSLDRLAGWGPGRSDPDWPESAFFTGLLARTPAHARG
jgi:hypothetical protein